MRQCKNKQPIRDIEYNDCLECPCFYSCGDYQEHIKARREAVDKVSKTLEKETKVNSRQYVKMGRGE